MYTGHARMAMATRTHSPTTQIGAAPARAAPTPAASFDEVRRLRGGPSTEPPSGLRVPPRRLRPDPRPADAPARERLRREERRVASRTPLRPLVGPADD